MNREIRIMVVDDEAAMRESLAGWLTKEGYRTMHSRQRPGSLVTSEGLPQRSMAGGYQNAGDGWVGTAPAGKDRLAPGVWSL